MLISTHRLASIMTGTAIFLASASPFVMMIEKLRPSKKAIVVMQTDRAAFIGSTSILYRALSNDGRIIQAKPIRKIDNTNIPISVFIETPSLNVSCKYKLIFLLLAFSISRQMASDHKKRKGIARRSLKTLFFATDRVFVRHELSFFVERFCGFINSPMTTI